MPSLIYALCALASLACSILLLAGARRTASRMLFWSGLCFAGLALSNGLIVLENMIEPNLGELRLSISLLSVSLLLYGLVFEEK